MNAQRAPVARFALSPGSYRAEVRFTSGFEQTKRLAVGTVPVRAILDDQMPAVE
jgi:hypothetical protein